MAVNGKQKGNSFERKISEALSLWLTDGAEKRAVWRSDTSGGAATVWAKKKEEARYVLANSGDIKQVADKGLYDKLDKYFERFVVECKSYKEIELYPPFNKTLTNWFDQLIREKETTGKKAVLIAKANNRKVLYCQEKEDQHPNTPKPLLTIYYKDLELNVFLFDDVVTVNNANDST